MTNEQIKAKELAELLNAFSEGKQLLLNSVTGWIDFKFESVAELTMYFFDPQNNIRIKPERKTVALNQQDLIDRELRKETLRIKNGTACQLIHDFNDEIVFLSDDEFTYEQLACLEWIDGTPCDKEVGCE